MASGQARIPIAVTTLRPERLAVFNRGRLRGWGMIAATILVLLALLSWPSLPSVTVFLIAAAAFIGAVAWVHFTLPVPEIEEYEERNSPDIQR